MAAARKPKGRITDRFLTLGYTVDQLVDMGQRGTIDAAMMRDLRGALSRAGIIPTSAATGVRIDLTNQVLAGADEWISEAEGLLLAAREWQVIGSDHAANDDDMKEATTGRGWIGYFLAGAWEHHANKAEGLCMALRAARDDKNGGA